MSFALFAQVVFNIIFAVGFIVVFARLRRPAKDDPRLSRGLQLLSSKIAVLEDLNDRTETQVQQMLALLDQKSKELQAKIGLADSQVSAIRVSMDKSLEVAKIFQDKIPHNEIIERQQSMKYIRAARMAHAGSTVQEIAMEVDLPMGEIEFIAKVNRESLTFREEELPEWAKEPTPAAVAAAQASLEPAHAALQAEMVRNEHQHLIEKLGKLQFEMQNLDVELASRAANTTAAKVGRDLSNAFEVPQVDSRNLERLGDEFRRAVMAAEAKYEAAVPAPAVNPMAAAAPAPLHFDMQPHHAPVISQPVQVSAAVAASAPVPVQKAVASGPEVRKVEFPRVDIRPANSRVEI